MYPSRYNSPLKKFKDVHAGQSAIVFATGPSIRKYEPFEGSQEAVTVGVNRIYTHPEITENLDYYFFGSHYFLDPAHRTNIERVCSRYNSVKLASAYENGLSHAQIGRGNITPERALELGAIPFENNLDEFSNDIAKYALLGHSIVFPALQFLLYTGVSKVYLVGCDGGETGRGDRPTSGNRHLIHWWKRFKTFRNEFYPEVEVVSINPVSLRGLFVDHSEKSLLDELFTKKRNLLAADNEPSMNLIGEQIPLRIHKFSSGTECFDWRIPRQWNLRRAVLKDSKGKVLIDSEDHILHVLGYSSPFKGEVSRAELVKHLHFDTRRPDAIPYRTSYYAENWGFCLRYNDFKNLTDDTYFVEIDADFSDGDLLIGEAVIKGKSKKEIILSSYYCHPQQANDGLSGVVLLVELYKKLREVDLEHTYRFFFWPETIGALTALSQGLINKEIVEFALVATTVGFGDKICYKKTHLGNHSLDNLMARIENIEVREFGPTGSDERQFSSPGIRIPTGVLTNIPFEEYDEYHTSLDNLDLISMNTIEEMAELYFNILLAYEKQPRYETQVRGGEPFLTKHGLYREISVPGHDRLDKLRNWVLFLSDGHHTITDMAAKSGFDDGEIVECLERLISGGVVRQIDGAAISLEQQLLIDYKDYYDQFEGRTWRTLESFQYCVDFVNLVQREIATGDKILEYGCGTGFNLNYLYHRGFKNLYGLDIDERAIEIARQKYGDISFEHLGFNPQAGSMAGLATFAEGDFDLIFCRAVLQQPRNDDTDVVCILCKLHDLLKPDGTLVLSEGQAVRDWDRLFATASLQTIFRDGDIRKLIKIDSSREELH